jgi:soluble lytic murein transglycosylase-like protein
MKVDKTLTLFSLALAIIVMIIANKNTEQAVEEPIEILSSGKVYVIEEFEVIDEENIKSYFDCQLSQEIQDHIFKTCEEYNVSPALVVAMIEQESQCNASIVGDSGASVGLMQIQARWHRARMNKLGCNDLSDPYQNITVGIDYIAELQAKNPDLYWVLMAYNGGEKYANSRYSKGNYSQYSINIMNRMNELEGDES